MTDEIKRFPRFLEGAQGAALTHMFWTEPEPPHIKVANDGTSINFVFKVCIREEALHGPFREYWSFFLAPPTHRLEKALQEGYDRTVSGKKPVHRHISNFLRRACVKAFQCWLESSWELAGDKQKKEGQLKVFEQQARIKPGRQPDPSKAIEAARLFRKYHQLIKTIRARLRMKKNVHSITGRDLAMEIGETIPPETIRAALRKIFSDPQADLHLMTAPSISAKEIASVIAETEMPGIDFRQITFKKYLVLGEQLLAATTDPPTPT